MSMDVGLGGQEFMAPIGGKDLGIQCLGFTSSGYGQFWISGCRGC